MVKTRILQKQPAGGVSTGCKQKATEVFSLDF